jgi:leucyl aminopeptidase
MRTQFVSVSKLSKITDLFLTPTVVVVAEPELKKGKWLSQMPDHVRERIEGAMGRLKDPAKAGSRFCVPGRSENEEDLWVAVLPNATETFFLLGFARDTLKQALHPSMTALRLVFLSEELEDACADAFGAAVSAKTFMMPVFGKREKDQKSWHLKQVELVCESRNCLDQFEYGLVTADGTNIARYLATLPPNILNPGDYGARIRKLCKENGITVKFYSNRELKKMGAGAFTAVDQGNPDSAGGIYELTYSPKAKAKKTIHFAGKGLCFDTGGYDVKTGGAMITMKGDMQGSSVALASMIVAIRLGLPYKMKTYLGITENHISPRSYKPDEVVVALNGTSIEVINTDAEGRMVLADTLTLASREKPDCLVDFATLTGSAVRAIGTKYSAGFTNRDSLHDLIKQAGVKSGERVWTFPIDSTFAKALESKIADTLQLVKGAPDHIMAACFLSKFVEEGTPWVHIDLSAAENSDGLAHVESMFTGFGVRWAIEFIKKV